MLVTRISPEDFPVQDNLFQTAFWGGFKTACGQQAVFFLCGFDDAATPDVGESCGGESCVAASCVADSCVAASCGGRRFVPLLVLLRNTGAGIPYAYVPKAPAFTVKEDRYGSVLEALAERIRPFLPDGTAFVRFDTAWFSPYAGTAVPRSEIREMRMNFGTNTRNLRKAGSDHFCPDTVLVDLTASPEIMLSRMRQTTRNAIRKSYRMGVSFSRKNADFLPVWHDLYRDTGLRKGFFTEELAYFETLFRQSAKIGRLFFKQTASPHEDCGKGPPYAPLSGSKLMSANPGRMPVSAPVPEPELYLLAAEKDEVLLAGLILAVCGKSAYYLFAGSRADAGPYMASYGLQWEAMLAARRAGCVTYDLLGIPPNNDKNHPMSGLYTFKTGLGGAVVRYCGCWDYPYDEDSYNRFRTAETLMGLPGL